MRDARAREAAPRGDRRAPRGRGDAARGAKCGDSRGAAKEKVESDPSRDARHRLHRL